MLDRGEPGRPEMLKTAAVASRRPVARTTNATLVPSRGQVRSTWLPRWGEQSLAELSGSTVAAMTSATWRIELSD
jgi:hypothetical protein